MLLTGIQLASASIEMTPQIRICVVNMVLIGIVISLAVTLTRLSTRAVPSAISKSKEPLPSISLFTNMTRFLIRGLGVMIILQLPGISITPFLTALGVFDFAVVLALQDDPANLLAGFQKISTSIVTNIPRPDPLADFSILAVVNLSKIWNTLKKSFLKQADSL